MSHHRPALVFHSERHGFTVARDYRNDRGVIVASQQSWHVTHPTGVERWIVIGFHRTLADAREAIDHAYADAHDATRLDELATKRRRWVEQLATWFPQAPNPPLALARMEAVEAERQAVDARQRAEAERIHRIHQHAEATLAALEALLVLYGRAQHLAEVRAAIAAVAQSRGIAVAEVATASNPIGQRPVAAPTTTTHHKEHHGPEDHRQRQQENPGS